MEFLAIVSFLSWFLLSFAVGRFAGNRGRSRGGWLLFSLAFSPLVGAAYVAVLDDESMAGKERRVSPHTHLRCPECRELVRRDACKCHHCAATLVPGGTD